MGILWWSDWWWLEHDWIIFPYIGNLTIPTDELIFFRGVGIPPTRNASEADAISATENSWWAIDASIRFKLSPKELVLARLQGAYCKTSNQPGARLQGLSHHKPSSFRFGIRLYPNVYKMENPWTNTTLIYIAAAFHSKVLSIPLVITVMWVKPCLVGGLEHLDDFSIYWE